MTPGTASPLGRARWWRILPLVFITFSLAYVDRANFGFAAAGGLAADLGLSSGTLSLLGSLFFLGYFMFQVPGAWYAERRSVTGLIFATLLIWGGCASLTGVLHSTVALLAVRFLLGAAEAAVIPALLIYLSNWFTKAERSRATALLLLGNPVTVLWMSIASGYLVDSVGWRWMFIIEGLPAVVWAFAWRALARERPAEAGWLKLEEREGLKAALLLEQAAIKPVKGYAAAFRSRAVIALCFLYFFWSTAAFGFILWLPAMLKEGRAMGMVETGWLSAIPYVTAIAGMLVVSTASDRRGHRQAFVGVALSVGAAAFLGCHYARHFWGSYLLLVVAGTAMYAPYGPFWASIPEMLPKNVAAGAIALVNSMGALGSFAGSYFVGYLNAATGNPASSHLISAAALGIAAVLSLWIGQARESRQVA